MIKSSKTTLSFTNYSKLKNIRDFINEYKKVVSSFIDLMWDVDNVPKLASKEITSKINTWLSARAIQCAGKQASGIVRGTRQKQNRRLFMINKLEQKGHNKKARKLRKIYNETKVSKPIVSNLQCELDSRFVKIDLNNKTSFDGWIILSSLGNKLKIKIPFKRHKHFNKLLNIGKLKSGVRLSESEVTFIFDIANPVKKQSGNTLGIDIGQTTTLSCSDGQMIDKCPHGHTYKTICQKLSRKQENSKNFKRAVSHRSNYLRYIVNQLNLDNIKTVNRENIQHLRKFSSTNRMMKHWNYAELFDVLDSKLESKGVLLNKINPTYTSQRCSNCGWTRKSNRKWKKFKCEKCSYESDSDLNASKNIRLNLMPIGKKERSQHKNKLGFYWNVESTESIVPNVQKV